MGEVLHLGGCRFRVVNSALEFTILPQSSVACHTFAQCFGFPATHTWGVYPVQAIQLVADRLVLTCTVEQEPAFFLWHVELMCACRIANLTATISIGPYTELRGVNLPFTAMLFGPNVAPFQLIGFNKCIESLDGVRCIRVVRWRGKTVYYNWQVGTCVFSTWPNWHSHQPQPEPIQLGEYYVSAAEDEYPYAVDMTDMHTNRYVDAIMLHPELDSKQACEWTINELQAFVHPPNVSSDPCSSVELVTNFGSEVCGTYQQYLYTAKGQTVECFDTHARCHVSTYDVTDDRLDSDIVSICASKTHLVVCRDSCIRIHALAGGQCIREIIYVGLEAPTRSYMTINGDVLAWATNRHVKCYEIGADRLQDVRFDSDVLQDVRFDSDVYALRVRADGTLVVVLQDEIFEFHPSNVTEIKKTDTFLPSPAPGFRLGSQFELSGDGSRLAVVPSTRRGGVVTVYSRVTKKTIWLETGNVINQVQFVPSRPALLLVCMDNRIMLFDADTGTRYVFWSHRQAGRLISVAPASVTMDHQDTRVARTVRFPQISGLAMLYLIVAGRRRPRQLGFYLPDELLYMILDEFMGESTFT